MARKTVLARKNEDGHLELLEPVTLPSTAVFTVIIAEADGIGETNPPSALPIRHLGAIREPLTRDEIYGDPI